METKHSIEMNGHKTSLSLENEFWEAFKAHAAKVQMTCGELAAGVPRRKGQNLSSAVRVMLFKEALKLNV